MRFFQGLERVGRKGSSVLLGKILNIPKTTLPALQQTFERGEIKKILLVRNYQGMGDLLCATPVIASLKARFPNAAIHFLANTFNAAALQNNPKLQKVWTWDENKKADPRQWLYFRKTLRREQFDLALVLSGNALSLTAILLADLSGARWVVGYDTQFYGQTWGSRLYSAQVPVPPAIREIDKYAGLVEGLGIPCPNRFPEFFVRPDQAESAELFWKQHFPLKNRPVVGLFLGGKTDRPDRIWPAENYAHVARYLSETKDCAILAITPPASRGNTAQRRDSTFWLDESVHEQRFRQIYRKECPVFRDRDLGRVGAILRKLTLFICPDGGMMHLAAALKVPTLTLFFGTDPAIWHPPVATSHYILAPDKNPQALEAKTVAEKAAQILSLNV